MKKVDNEWVQSYLCAQKYTAKQTNMYTTAKENDAVIMNNQNHKR